MNNDKAKPKGCKSRDYRNCVNRIDGRRVDGDISWMTACRLRKTETMLHNLLAKVEHEMEARKNVR